MEYLTKLVRIISLGPMYHGLETPAFAVPARYLNGNMMPRKTFITTRRLLMLASLSFSLILVFFLQLHF